MTASRTGSSSSARLAAALRARERSPCWSCTACTLLARLVERIGDDEDPSIPMMRRVEGLIGRFGT